MRNEDIEMTEELAMDVLGLDSSFTFIGLTRAFAKVKNEIENEDELETIADAYDYLKINFKRIKSKGSVKQEVEISGDIFPTIHPYDHYREVLVDYYPVGKRKDGTLLPVTFVPGKDFNIPSIVEGDFFENQPVAVYHKGQLYVGPARIATI